MLLQEYADSDQDKQNSYNEKSSLNCAILCNERKSYGSDDLSGSGKCLLDTGDFCFVSCFDKLSDKSENNRASKR